LDPLLSFSCATWPARPIPACRIRKESIMSEYGKIANYDTATGKGFILPEKGGEQLPFVQGELDQAAKLPLEKDRYAYEMGKDTAGESCAVKLRHA
jgi:CspA family cold shock protein